MVGSGRKGEGGGCGGVPRIFGEVGGFECLGGAEGHYNNFIDHDAFVVPWESAEQFRGAAEESGGRLQAASMDAMMRFAAVVLEVDVGAGELNEGFVVGVGCAGRSQPDVLEDIVGGVIFVRVEEAKVFHVAGVKSGAAVGAERSDFLSNFCVFTH